jgi:hypothetical protein
MKAGISPVAILRDARKCALLRMKSVGVGSLPAGSHIT